MVTPPKCSAIVFLIVWTAASAVSAQIELIFGETLPKKRLTLTVLGQGLSPTLRQILAASPDTAADQIWLDRHIDPDTPVSLAGVGPTAAAVLIELTRKYELAVFPLPGVLVVGRTTWVERAAADAIRLRNSLPASSAWLKPIAFDWPEDTSAGGVLQKLMEAMNFGKDHMRKSVEAIPHDVWAGQTFQRIEPVILASLVLSRFDLTVKDFDDFTIVPTQPSSPVTLFYKNDLSPQVLRNIAREQKETFRSTRSDRGNLRVTAPLALHRRFLEAYWSKPVAQDRPLADQMTRFDLQLVNKPAASALAQLAATRGGNIQVSDEAKSASEKIISLDAKQQTLDELIQSVANRAGLTATWQNQTLRIDLDRRP